MKIRHILNIISPFTLFAAVSITGIILYFICAYFIGANAYDWLAMENNGRFQFCDYFLHISFVTDPPNLYSYATGGSGCFPPLAYVMYYFLFRITKRKCTIPIDWKEAEKSEYAMLVFLYYTIFVVLLFAFSLQLWDKNRKQKNSVLLICILLSVPFYQGGIERGNSTVLVMVLCLLALKLRESNTQPKREAALFLIALSAGFKIYPAILGFLYIKEKRYKEALRLTLYGTVLFFVPFIWFGGENGFLLWWRNVTDTLMSARFGRIQYIRGFIYSLTQYLSGKPDMILVNVIPYIFILLMVILSWVSKSGYRSIFFLCAAMVFFPSNAYRYTLCYFCIPLIAFFSKEESRDILTWIEAGLFGILFSIPSYLGIFTKFKLSMPYYTLTYVEIWIYTAAYLLTIIMVIHEFYCLKLILHKTG